FAYRSPPRSTLSPYTTLFRSFRRGRKRLSGISPDLGHSSRRRGDEQGPRAAGDVPRPRSAAGQTSKKYPTGDARGQRGLRVFRRSEEHTSELQSRVDLVCRLL